MTVVQPFPKTHIIHTPRLTIRPILPADAPAIAALLGNPLNNPFTPVSAASALASTYEPRITQWAAAMAAGESAFMVICQRPAPSSSPSLSSSDSNADTGPVIGFGGFNGFFTTHPDSGRILTADMGIVIDHRVQRQGLGREALEAHIGYAFAGPLRADKVTMGTAEANEPFRALVRAVGLARTERKWRVGDDEHGGEGDWVYEVGRGDWEAARKGWGKGIVGGGDW